MSKAQRLNVLIVGAPSTGKTTLVRGPTEGDPSDYAPTTEASVEGTTLNVDVSQDGGSGSTLLVDFQITDTSGDLAKARASLQESGEPDVLIFVYEGLLRLKPTLQWIKDYITGPLPAMYGVEKMEHVHVTRRPAFVFVLNKADAAEDDVDPDVVSFTHDPNALTEIRRLLGISGADSEPVIAKMSATDSALADDAEKRKAYLDERGEKTLASSRFCDAVLRPAAQLVFIDKAGPAGKRYSDSLTTPASHEKDCCVLQ